jgi:capsular exopolysaccharide synthesis family protein
MQDDNKYKAFYIDDSEQQDDEINLREAFEKYSYHWKWFVLGVFIALTAAFIYLRYATYQYEVSSTILIDDKDNGGGLTSELSAFEDLGLLSGSKTSLDTEMGVLKSRTLMERVIKELNLQVTYYSKGRIGTNEVYKSEVPFNVNLFVNDSILYTLDTTFTITAFASTRFVLKDSDGNQAGQGVFGENIQSEFGSMIITPTNINSVKEGQEIMVRIKPLEEVAIAYKKLINIAPESKKSSLLILSLKDPVKKKAEAILDNLISYYNKDAIEDKSQIAKNTDVFINNRIDDISVELTNLDMGVENYKTENKLSDIASEAGLVLQSNADLTNQIVDLTSQIKLIDYVIRYMKSNKDELIPSNLGVLNESTGQNTLNYNKLLRESIDQGLRNSRSSLSIALNEARIQENRLDTKISSAPKKEREIRDIQRQQQIIETLYLYLLQKREENSISLAVTAPNAKIIDRAYGSDIPVSPKKMIVYIVALLLGLIVPFMVIYIRLLLDNKIHTLEDVEAVVKAPILGDIPMTRSEKKVIISEQDRSNVAESFRLLRTNVNFMLPGAKDAAKTIFITSTIGGEGKTFIAINLASALALLNKKVLLIGADIRKPKIATYLNTKQEKGLTHYLIDTSLKVADVIVHHKETNLDVLETGIIPPNPSELLTNGRFDEVIAYGKANYDYIIIDTAPVNIVTDTLLLGHHADLFIFVIRANFLDKRLLKIPKTMYENKRLPNMAVLINDTNYEKRGYGYGYGYGYGQPDSKRPWWKRIIAG